MFDYEGLKRYLNKNKITAYRISKDTGLPNSTISDWINGKSTPNYNNLRTLSEYLGLDVGYFDSSYSNDLEEMIANPESVVTIPVLGLCPCGVPIEAIENVLDHEEISASMAKKGAHFGLLAVGDSMFPSIIADDVLIVRQTNTVESGSVAIVKVNGDDATCKKIMIDEDGITLIPFNTMYDPIRYNNEQIEKLPITICGQVVEVRRKF